MFWPQTLWQWIIVFAIVIFVVKAYRSFTDENKEENIFTPLLHIAKRAKDESKGIHNMVYKISRKIIQGNDRKKK